MKAIDPRGAIRILLLASGAIVPIAQLAAGDECVSPTSCVFRGLQNNALGAATLHLDPSGNLVIENIGPSGDDGVQIINPGLAFTGHDEWIILGYTSQLPKDAGATVPGDKIDHKSTSDVGPFAGSGLFALRFEEIPGGLIQIAPDLTASGATTLRYEVRENGVLRGSVSGQPMSSTVHTSHWPTAQAFSFVQWSQVVSIGLPGLGVVQGNQLEIIPENPTAEPIAAQRMELTARAIGPAMTSLTITDESFEATLPEPAPERPAASLAGLALASALVLAAMAWLLGRSSAT